MPHARLFAASSLVTAGLLALGPEAVVALADTDSGSSSTGGSTTGSSGTTGTTTGTTTGGTTTGSDTSTTTGGSTTTGSTTTGSSTSSTTGSSSSPNLQTTLGGMVGQFTRIIQHPTSIIGGAPLTGLVPGVKPKPGQNAPLLPPGASSTFSASVPAPTNGAPQPSAAAAPEPTKNSQDANVATEPKAPLAQLPLAVAQVPLTALDLVKTTIPTVVEAVPIPGLAALPVFADALINPIESTVRDLAVAASNLPFLQYTPGMPAIQLPPDNRTLQLNAPQMPKTFGASTDSVPRDISPGTPGTLDKPVPPVQPRDVFAAETHLVAAKDFRPGYPDYLRAAGLSEVAAVAVPGFAGIITLTAAGGLIGFRQARATSSAPARAQRFVN